MYSIILRSEDKISGDNNNFTIQMSDILPSLDSGCKYKIKLSNCLINQTNQSEAKYAELRIKIGSTTGFDKEQVELVREKLEDNLFDVDKNIQESNVISRDEIEQLKSTIQSLRYNIERNEAKHIEELQKAKVNSLDERSQLEETISALRNKLEKNNGNKS